MTFDAGRWEARNGTLELKNQNVEGPTNAIRRWYVEEKEKKKNFARAFADSLNFQTDRERVFISQFARRSLSTDGIVKFRGR